MPETHSTVIPGHRYRNAPAAIEWLCTVFGFERNAVYEDEHGGIAHCQLTLGGGMLMLGSQRDDEYGRGFKMPTELGGIETRSVYIVVADVDAVHARAVEAGATIFRPLQDTAYGSREFGVKDPEGHSWTAGTYNPWTAHE